MAAAIRGDDGGGAPPSTPGAATLTGVERIAELEAELSKTQETSTVLVSIRCIVVQ